eukprot:scaffold251655_cov13-Tisochrysis_lutea.AAC.1
MPSKVQQASRVLAEAQNCLQHYLIILAAALQAQAGSLSKMAIYKGLLTNTSLKNTLHFKIMQMTAYLQ